MQKICYRCGGHDMKEFIDTLIDALSGGWSQTIGPMEVFTALCMASLIAVYIYVIYILTSKKSFYSRDFNITLACVTLITTGLVSAIQSSLLVTLSVGGALSIIRFRTAIKSPIDLMFLFWSIACGIMCGTGVATFAMMLSVFLTVIVFALTKLPLIRAPYLMIINAKNKVDVEKIKDILNSNCRYYDIKSSSVTKDHKDMTVELRTVDVDRIIEEINKIKEVESVSVLEHNGDAAF